VGLNSYKEDEIRGAVFGIFNWLANQVTRNLIPPPPDLLDDLVNKVLARRQPGLIFAIAQLGEVIQYMPDMLNVQQAETLCTALEYLLEETRLAKKDDLQEPVGVFPPILYDERPDYRNYSADLAYHLKVFFKNKEKDLPPIIVKWEEAAKADCLPEVKRAWRLL
jgi:hypothetical protein